MICKISTDWKKDLSHRDMITLAMLSRLYVENLSNPVQLSEYDLSDYCEAHDFYRSVRNLVEKGYAIKIKEEGKKQVQFMPNLDKLGTYIENLEVEFLFKE